MRLRAAAVLLITLALAACATKPPPPVAPTQAAWDAVSAADYTCKRGDFVNADFTKVVTAPERYFEKCLRLRALLAGDHLLANAASLNTPPGHDLQGTIGIYLKDDKLVAGIASHPQFVLVEGRLRSCDARFKAMTALGERKFAAESASLKSGENPAPEEIPTLKGFCHYTTGPAIFITSITPIPTAMD